VRLRLIRAGYKVAWVLLWLLSPLHRGRGRGVKGILSHEGRVLLVQHTYGPRRWEIPGGGLRRGEEPVEGIRREIREELGVEVPVPTVIAIGSGSGRESRRRMTYFAAELADARVTPDPGEIARAQWHDPAALPSPLGWHVARAIDVWRGGTSAPPADLRER
jgi:8-oxo-dGTP pyrophosphatase MutT (NUDIX family)